MLYFLSLLSVALAAWPDSYEHRIAAMEAIRYDLAMPGIPYRESEIRAKYKIACDKGYSAVCKPEKWMTSRGSDLEKIRETFENRCTKSKSPLPCVAVGLSYGMLNGRPSVGATNPERAVQAFRTACKDKAYAPGCTYLGDMYADGVGVKQDLVQAEKLYKEGCQAKDAWGCHRLADLYTQTDDPENKRYDLYRRSCRNGYALGCIEQATIMQQTATKKSQWRFIAQQFDVACRYGQMERCADLAVLYHKGRGIKQSLPTAMSLYQTTCAMGTADSCHAMGVLLMEMEEPNFEKAGRTFLKACDGGYAKSCTKYGEMYLQGIGVEPNLKYALKFMNKGCDAGDLDGCLVLAEAYAKGNGVGQDISKATKFAIETCQAGYGRGCYALAQLNEGGDVWGKKSLYDPVKMYAKACKLGDGRGCSELALREVAKGNATPAVQEKLKVGCKGEDTRACMVLADLNIGTDMKTAMQYWLKACEFRHAGGCLSAGKQYQKEGDIVQAAELFEQVCNTGGADNRGCKALEPIAFQGGFQEIVDEAFTNNLCTVFAEIDEDNLVLMAEAKGASISLHAGSFSGSTAAVLHMGNDVQLDGIQRGESQWNVGGKLPSVDSVWGEDTTPEPEAPPEQEIWGEAKADDWNFTVKHIEEWNSSKGSIRRDFPGVDTKMMGDKGILLYNRDEEKLFGGCGFPMQQKTLLAEDCSEIQALIIGYSLLGC